MTRAALLVACLLPALATAAQPRERWSFAWDAHPQAAEVGYFVLDIRLPGKLIRQRISGGTATAVRDVLVPASIPGEGVAVLRACRPTGECSADSNAVALDRTPPQPPTAVTHGFNQRYPMALIKPQGSLSWTASPSTDVVSYELYQGEQGQAPTYDSPHVDVGNVTSATLPVEGLPMVEGTVIFAVAAVDAAGNKSDLAPVAPVLIDVTPPLPPIDPVYSRDF